MVSVSVCVCVCVWGGGEASDGFIRSSLLDSVGCSRSEGEVEVGKRGSQFWHNIAQLPQ